MNSSQYFIRISGFFLFSVHVAFLWRFLWINFGYLHSKYIWYIENYTIIQMFSKKRSFTPGTCNTADLFLFASLFIFLVHGLPPRNGEIVYIANGGKMPHVLLWGHLIGIIFEISIVGKFTYSRHSRCEFWRWSLAFLHLVLISTC